MGHGIRIILCSPLNPILNAQCPLPHSQKRRINHGLQNSY
ncbi:hypothetical protein COO91_05505 [Nostoc flagelliforme CCNUN1]|uniref:Uncharacterized protein n=1 Tax=Nostoc flagelliforme CCNUN1 TaxID=2038116 RepID=A0A2K8SVL6_9NOSO|nr:hypothetical protein COO91_05505 [Nostoc flagelliforme CCNUN1]